MLTAMTEEDWTIVLQVFDASRSRRGDKGRDDRRFLEALHYFVVHNITWRALPEKFGHWNSVWKQFWRLSRTGITQRTEAAAANSPHIETVRVKPLEPAAASYQFRLGDGNVDLMKAFSLSSERSIGASWQAPAHIAAAGNTFDERFGQW